MRIKELSDRSGVSIPSIKYYIREGLLAPGDRTARTQADYDEGHVARLELIKALREGAGLTIATLTRVFAAMAKASEGVGYEYLGIAVAGLTHPVEIPEGEEDDYAASAEMVEQLLERLDWQIRPGSPPTQELTRALVQVRRYLPGLVDQPNDLLPHAEAVRTLADHEIPANYDPSGDPDHALRLAVLGTSLFEPVLLALRKLAHVDRVRGVASPRGNKDSS